MIYAMQIQHLQQLVILVILAVLVILVVMMQVILIVVGIKFYSYKPRKSISLWCVDTRANFPRLMRGIVPWPTHE
ncbi:MAG: hypothetical protein A3E88_04890 [Legionellales bacterium RIFCSPHIGHO2_12_FULL_35_11]|nr:MAG: hypothetical protein A3E88_04890 [Legionellales bacterium RIFCSPHIGHO2_12_FULL_35_11]